MDNPNTTNIPAIIHFRKIITVAIIPPITVMPTIHPIAVLVFSILFCFSRSILSLSALAAASLARIGASLFSSSSCLFLLVASALSRAFLFFLFLLPNFTLPLGFYFLTYLLFLFL